MLKIQTKFDKLMTNNLFFCADRWHTFESITLAVPLNGDWPLQFHKGEVRISPSEGGIVLRETYEGS